MKHDGIHRNIRRTKMNEGTRINYASWETINLKLLRRLPVYVLPPSYQLQQDSGNGCAGDPPGYPTYFTKCVYTQYGNKPPFSCSMVIRHNDRLYEIERGWSCHKHVSYDDYRATADALMRRLWLPLPLEHPRTQAWIADKFRHLRHCYLNPALSGRERWNKLVIYPVPDYELNTFIDDACFSDKWRAKERAAIIQANADIVAAAYKIATHDNHAAVVSIREYYPEFQPTQDQIDGKVETIGLWWETMAKRPTPDKCPGQYGTPHPVNGTWCQFCGYKFKVNPNTGKISNEIAD
jgi:hypothetical protein